jgi:hypothetical protein
MTDIPPSPPKPATEDAPLNPALKPVLDGTYGRDHEGTDPMATVSVKKDDGVYWPFIWAAATIVCVIVAIILIAF